MRFFNTAGPVNPEDHYCLPPLERFDLSEILMLIDRLTRKNISCFTRRDRRAKHHAFLL